MCLSFRLLLPSFELCDWPQVCWVQATTSSASCCCQSFMLLWSHISGSKLQTEGQLSPETTSQVSSES